MAAGWKGFATDLENAVGAALATIGAQGRDIIQQNLTEQSVDTGRLKDSISFSTDRIKAVVGGAAKEVDRISQPPTKYTVFIGTACPYGPYVEHGSTPHGASSDEAGAEGEGSFHDRIMDWARRHGFDEMGARFLMKRIRDRGIKEQPFIRPAEATIERIASEAVAKAVKDLMQKMPTTKEEIVVHVSFKGIS